MKYSLIAPPSALRKTLKVEKSCKLLIFTLYSAYDIIRGE